MRTLNIRLLAILLVGTLLTAAVGYGVHGYQIRRNAGSLLRRAETAKEQAEVAKEQSETAKAAEKRNEAIDLYQRYVSLVPHDSGEALAELGLLQVDAKRYGPAVRNLRSALRQLPETDGERRRKLIRTLVDANLSIGNYSDARRQLEGTLLKTTPDDPELLELLARCQYAAGDYQLAIKSLISAVEENPEQLDAYAFMAAIYEERLQERDKARDALDRMIDHNPESARAYLIRGTYRTEHLKAFRTAETEQANLSAVSPDVAEQGKASLAAALEDARRALELAPKDRDVILRDVILFAVRTALANNQIAEARKYAEQGRALFPENPTVYALLASVELKSKKRSAAIDWLKEGIKIAPERQRQDLVWNLCNLYLEPDEGDDRTISPERAEEVKSRLDELRREKYPVPPIEYLEARRLILQKPRQWLEASIKLEKNRAALAPWPELQHQSDVQLGYCYKGLGNPDLQLNAFRRAVSANPMSVPARLGVADALVAINNVEGALREYQEIVNLTEQVDVWLEVVRFMIMSNLRRKAEERNWETVTAILNQIEKELEQSDESVEKAKPRFAELAILKAEVLFAKNEVAKAVELLQAARDRDPEELRLWIALAGLAEQRDDSAGAKRILDEAQAKNRDRVLLRLARARLLVNERDPNAGTELRKLATPAPDYTSEDRAELYSGIAMLQSALDDFDETARLCKAVVAERPTDLLARLFLFDTAIRAGQKWETSKRLAVMSEVLRDLVEIDGKSPLWQYGSAVELRIRADQAQRDGKPELRSKLLKEAKQHLLVAGASRRNWSRIPLLMADINRAEGDIEAAVNNYLKAIEFGEQNPEILSRTVILLHEQRKFEKADALIRRLEQQVRRPFTNELIQMATVISMELDDRSRALDFAVNRFRPRNAAELVWAGNIFYSLGNLTDAEANFRKAIELDETWSEAWVALIQFLGNTKQFDKASAEFALAETKINRDEVATALARCIEFTGRSFDEMEARFQATLAASPNDPAAIRGIVEFYMRQPNPARTMAKAEKLLLQVLSSEFKASPEDQAWARRSLALALTFHYDQAAKKRALNLLEENLNGQLANDADRRAKALILSGMREREAKLEAAELLEKLLSDSQSQDAKDEAEERFVLAQIYYALGDQAKVQSHMRTLLAKHGDVRRYVEMYAKYLISIKDVDEAEKWLKGLENADKSQRQDEFSKLRFGVEAFYVQEKFNEVVTAVDAYVNEQPIEPAERRIRIRRATALLEDYSERLKKPEIKKEADKKEAKSNPLRLAASARFIDKVEELLRLSVRENPAEGMNLAGFCARQGKLDESIEILERTWNSAQPVEITAVTIAIMISPAATPQQLATVEKVLRAAVDALDRNELLVQALADLQSWREEYDEAEALYEESLKKREHPLALNNLALLLAFRGKGGNKPLELIERAIEQVGSDPSLLDSRATVNLALGNPQLSMPDLILAIDRLTALNRPSPLNYFHQAQVALRLGQRDRAKEAMSKAQELGLQVENLHPLERKSFRELQQELR